MSLNENSSREKILDYIKKYAFDFINHFSDEPLTQPYIDEAVKEVAKRHPKYFLEKWADRFPQAINFALFALGNKNVAE